MTTDAEMITCRAAIARQMVLDLNEALALLVAEGCDVIVEVENRYANAAGYKSTKTPHISLRVLKEVE